jgi:hypothetical protein
VVVLEAEILFCPDGLSHKADLAVRVVGAVVEPPRVKLAEQAQQVRVEMVEQRMPAPTSVVEAVVAHLLSEELVPEL